LLSVSNKKQPKAFGTSTESGSKPISKFQKNKTLGTVMYDVMEDPDEIKDERESFVPPARRKGNSSFMSPSRVESMNH